MGKVVYHWDDLRYSPFDNTNLRLAAIAGSDSFYYCIADASSASVVKGYHAEKNYLFFDHPLGYLDTLVAQDPLLCADFSSVCIALRGVPFVPLADDEDDGRLQLKMITDIGPNDLILKDEGAEVSLGYLCPTALTDAIGEWYHVAEIRHVMSSLMAWSIRLSQEQDGFTVLVNHTDSLIEIVVSEHGRIHFANHFRISAAEDVLYFISMIKEDLGLGIADMHLRISGHGAVEVMRVLSAYYPDCSEGNFSGFTDHPAFPRTDAADLLSLLV